jgi:hypothetical protein
MAVQSSTATVLNVPSATISATTTSADLSVGLWTALAIDVNLTALGGTSPTYTLIVNRKGADGIYYPIYTGSTISAAQKISLSLGHGLSNNVAFGDTIQIVETLSGTSPTVTRSMSIKAK